MIPSREVKNYAEIEFDMMEEDDCEECNTEDFEDYEIADEYFNRRLGDEVSFDIVTDYQLEELTSKFLAADLTKRNEILKLL